MPNPDPMLVALLEATVAAGASDLHLTPGRPATARRDGILVPFEGVDVLTGHDTERMVMSLLNERQKEELDADRQVDFSFGLTDIGRFRANAFKQRSTFALALRVVPNRVRSLDELGAPMACMDLLNKPYGLVLVVGPTGSGKSTTLAAMIDKINQTKPCHILTIEDPIEFLHKHKKSIVNQREVGLDTHAFHNALKNAMREAPDVILIGEILDTTTMEAAISFAETGHLCLATLHSNNADQTLERILNFFPESAHKNILLNLALNLKAVISQRLVVGADGKRLPAAEILINTPLIRDLIRRGEVHEIKEAMDKSLQDGMQTFDQCLFKLYKEGKIDLEEALRKADSRDGLALKIRLSEGASGEHDPYADTFGEESSFG